MYRNRQGPSLVSVGLWWRLVLTVETGEAEHADLLGDVVPGPWRPQSLELLFQLSPHQQHPVSHGLHIVLPRADNNKKKSPQGMFLRQCERRRGDISLLTTR